MPAEVAQLPHGERHPSATRGSSTGALVAVAVWVTLLGLARVWGERLVAGGAELKLGTPPFHAVADLRIGWRHLVPIVVGGMWLVAVPRWSTSLRWRWVVGLAAGAAVVWAVALNVTDGIDGGLLRGLESPRHEYPADVARIDDPLRFLSGFTEDIDRYVTHVRGHPPGFLLLLWVLDRMGLSGVPTAAAVSIAGAGLAAACVVVAVRDVAGEDLARRAVPFVGAAPAALWMASSADALFAGVGALAVALVVLATGRSGHRSDLLALGGGVVGGLALMGSYGMVLVACVPAAVAWRRRRGRPLLLAGLGGAVVLGAFAAAGFWWVEGLRATSGEYHDGIASLRPYRYFVVANVAAFALAVGPATAAGLARLRDPGLWVVVGGALAAVAVADLSGMSKGEVERIWLPFAVWVAAAGAALWPPGAGRAVARGWLGLQMAVALAVQTWYVTGW